MKNFERIVLTTLLLGVLFPFAHSISSVNMTTSNCFAEDLELSNGSFIDSCDSTYPGNTLLYDDARNESYQVRKQGKDNYWAGIKTLSLDENVSCDRVKSVEFCYKWWPSTARIQGCHVSVDSNGGANYSKVSGACPGSSEPATKTCINVTQNESWSCGNFFGTNSTGALAKSEVQHDGTGSNGYFDVLWDVFHFRVVKNSFPEIQLNGPSHGASKVVVNQTLNVTVFDADEDTLDIVFHNASDDSVLCSYLGVSSGSSVTCELSSLKKNTTYEWYVNVTDGSKTIQSSTWNFTTEEGNTAPLVKSIELSSSPLAPGTTQTIKIKVKDKEGADTIKEINVTIWNDETSKEKSKDDWDHYTLENGTWDSMKNINSTTDEYKFNVVINKHALNGTYTVKAYVEDEEETRDSNETKFEVLTRTGVVLDTLTLTVSGKAGEKGVLFNEGPQNITHDGNVNQEIYINGTNLAGPENIAVNNITYSDNLGTPMEYRMTSQEVLFNELSPMNRGTYPESTTKQVYHWLDYPLGIKTGDYRGIIVIKAK